MNKNNIIIAAVAAVACCFMGYVIGTTTGVTPAGSSPSAAKQIQCVPSSGRY